MKSGGAGVPGTAGRYLGELKQVAFLESRAPSPRAVHPGTLLLTVAGQVAESLLGEPLGGPFSKLSVAHVE